MYWVYFVPTSAFLHGGLFIYLKWGIQIKMKCVMCEEPPTVLAEAKYSKGVVKEPLCVDCGRIDIQIRREREVTEHWRTHTDGK